MQVSQLRHWSVTTSSASSVRPLDPSVCLCVNASGCVKELFCLGVTLWTSLHGVSEHCARIMS